VHAVAHPTVDAGDAPSSTLEPPLRAYKLIVAYDGAAFCGWQRQAQHRTVQEVLEQAIAELTGEKKVTVLASSRTDTGVHAIGQCASFRSRHWRAPAHRLAMALNTKLPDDVSVRQATEVPLTFSPLRHTVSKRYRYRIYASRIPNPLLRRNAWWVKRRLDLDAMRAAADILLGKHDFLSFQTTGSPRKATVRTVLDITIESQPCLDGQEVTIEVEANGFLYNMVRNIVGSLVVVGVGHRDVTWMETALAARDRRASGPTAPPYGLCLQHVVFASSDQE
jgi:tRNA pseudouridine38-40 synthase